MKKTSNSENLILQLFWNNKYQIACHEIYKRVREAYPNHWKDSSVAVFLMRMEEKELIRKAEIDGTKYWVSINPGKYSKNLLNSILMKSENKTFDEILLGFIEDPEKHQAALDEIDAVIRKYEAMEQADFSA